MSYSKKATKSLDEISDITRQIESLREGEILRLEEDPEVIGRIRHLTYQYLHSSGVKQLFKLVRPFPEVLQIIRKKIPRPKIMVESPNFNEIKEFIINNLLEVEDGDHAIELIRLNLDKSLWISAVAEWRRMIGREAKTAGGLDPPND